MRDGDSVLVKDFGPDSVDAVHIVPQSRPDVSDSFGLCTVLRLQLADAVPPQGLPTTAW